MVPLDVHCPGCHAAPKQYCHEGGMSLGGGTVHLARNRAAETESRIIILEALVKSLQEQVDYLSRQFTVH